MKFYYDYDPAEPKQIIGELHKIQDGCILLDHIPLKNSIEIPDFVQSDSAVLQPGQFRCDYGEDLNYRESNGLIYFNDIHNGNRVLVSYLCVGTLIIADDLNEIKAHLENFSLHNTYSLPTASSLEKGGIRVGNGLEMVGDILNSKSNVRFLGSVDEFPANKNFGDLLFFEGDPYIFDGDNWLALRG